MSVIGKGRKLYLSVGAGVGGVWAENTKDEWRWGIGIPLEAQFLIVASKRFGIGLVVLANLNTVRTCLASTLCITFGRLRN